MCTTCPTCAIYFINCTIPVFPFSVFESLNQVVVLFGESVLTPYRELKKFYDKCASRPRLHMYLDHRKPRSR